jgi:hypothetical protein
MGIRKILFISIVAIALIAGAAAAQNMVTADSVVIAWDAVSAPVDSAGNPYAGTMKYQAYVRRDTAGAQAEKAGEQVGAPTATVTMPSPGKWWVGVQAIFTFSGYNNAVKESAIAWSDNAASVQDGKTFGVIFLPTPASPVGLRK